MATYKHIVVPEGEKIYIKDGLLQTPDHPIIGFIEGDDVNRNLAHRGW